MTPRVTFNRQNAIELLRTIYVFRSYFHTYGSISLTWVTFQVSYDPRRWILRSGVMRDGVEGGV